MTYNRRITIVRLTPSVAISSFVVLYPRCLVLVSPGPQAEKNERNRGERATRCGMPHLF